MGWIITVEKLQEIFGEHGFDRGSLTLMGSTKDEVADLFITNLGRFEYWSEEECFDLGRQLFGIAKFLETEAYAKGPTEAVVNQVFS